MRREWLVELARDLSQLMKSGPGNRREVMVLVVQTDVVGEEVENAIVRVCLHRGGAIRGGVPRRRGGLFKNVLGHEVSMGIREGGAG